METHTQTSSSEFLKIPFLNKWCRMCLIIDLEEDEPPIVSGPTFLSLSDLRQNTTKMSDGDFFMAGMIGYLCEFICVSVGSRFTYTALHILSIWQGIQLGKRTKTICHFWFLLTSKQKEFFKNKGVNKTKHDLISNWKHKH